MAIKGQAEFHAFLAGLPKKVRQVGATQARKEAERIAQAMETLKPLPNIKIEVVDGVRRPANVRGKTTPEADAVKVSIIATASTTKDAQFNSLAHWMEFGVKPHSTVKGAKLRDNKLQDGPRQHPGIQAQPFFWPVWRAYRRQTRGNIGRAINRALKSLSS